MTAIHYSGTPTLETLAPLSRWVTWRNERRGDDLTKVPYNPRRPQQKARADDPTTWGTEGEAKAAVPVVVNGQGGGIGVELGDLGDGWGLGGIDLDTCRQRDGTLDPAAAAILTQFATYSEVSPSGTGVKLLFLFTIAALPDLRRVMGIETGKKWAWRSNGKHPPGIELYLTGRFFAVTGQHHPDTPHELRLVPAEMLMHLIEHDGPAFAASDPANPEATRNPKSSGSDKSRSATAFRLGASLRHAGKTFEQICSVLRADPSTADWCREKGDANDQRELRRIWDKAGAEQSDDPTNGGLEVEIVRLAALSPTRYEQQRPEAAKRFNIRASFLDKQVAAARGAPDAQQGRPLELLVPEPWPDSVDGAALLVALAEFFTWHAFLPHRASTALALWTVHTYAFEVFRHTPRLHVRAIAKNSGKTTVLDLLEMVVCRALPTAHATSAILFRAIEMAKPTLLIDEADTFVNDNEEVRGVLNAGHKRGGQVLRAVGDDFQPRAFCVCSPVAIAGIGNLPGTIADRSIVIPMKRAMRSEMPAAIGREAQAAATRLARQAVRWALDHEADLAALDPDMGTLFNRLADNWRPLYAIADLAGDNWPDLARKAADVLTVADDDAETLSVKLLADIREVFASPLAAEELASQALCDRLGALEGRPWAEFGRTGKPVTANRLARLLKPFMVIPGNIGPEGARVRGYQLASFLEAFGRHLPSQPLG